MNILLLSLGGGGGNILRSLKALYRRDLAVAEQTDAAYAARLKNSVATRFADTNRFSLMDVPDDERVLIGAAATQHLGARHDPDLARRAFEESRGEFEQLIGRYSTVIIIATGGKGTGTGTMVPAALLARRQKKLVIPIFVRPSFERHEVEKRRYDQALAVSQQLDAAQIRFLEILNDRGYVDADPQPQSVVWERMNVPVARALRSLLYVLWDLSQVDPSDLSALFAGPGRLRIGFSELDAPSGSDPSDQALTRAVRGCWENDYCNFSEPVGTSLVCIQGPWSNVADAKIKSGLSAHATGAGSTAYNPLYARAFQVPQPWGVTALFAEQTGSHPPIDVDWSLEAVHAASTEAKATSSVVRNCNRPRLPQLLGPRARDQSLRSRRARDGSERRQPERQDRSHEPQETARHSVVPLGLLAPLACMARTPARGTLTDNVVLPNHVLKVRAPRDLHAGGLTAGPARADIEIIRERGRPRATCGCSSPSATYGDPKASAGSSMPSIRTRPSPPRS